jgi:hypothetical protein
LFNSRVRQTGWLFEEPSFKYDGVSKISWSVPIAGHPE